MKFNKKKVTLHIKRKPLIMYARFNDCNYHNHILVASVSNTILILLVFFIQSGCKKSDTTAPTQAQPAATPVAQPGINITATGFTAVWDASGGAVSYNLYVATDSTFQNSVAGYNPLSVTVTKHQVTPVAGGENYYYKVTAVGQDGKASSESKTIKVTTLLNSDNQYVYIGSTDDSLHCYNAFDGSRVWASATGDYIQSSPVIADGIVYAGSNDHKLHAFDINTGTEKWAFTTGASVVGSPVIKNSVVFVGSFDSKLYALNESDGMEKWSVPLTNQPAMDYTIFTGITENNGWVFFGSFSDSLYAFDEITGIEKWSVSLGGIILSSPLVDGGYVYIGGSNNTFYCVDALTGNIKWSKATGKGITSSPAISNNVVYTGCDDGKLYAFDAASGAMLWSVSIGNIVQSSPFVYNGTVYIGSYDKKLYAIDAATGAVKWSFTTGDVVASSPVINDGIGYVGSMDKKLYAFNIQNGNVLWSVATGGQIQTSSPCILTTTGDAIHSTITGEN